MCGPLVIHEGALLNAQAVPRLLIVDLPGGPLRSLASRLSSFGLEIIEAESFEQARDLVERELFELLLLSESIPDGSALDLVRHASSEGGVPQIILAGDPRNVEMAVEAVRLGASDYLSVPVDFEHFEKRVRAALEVVRFHRQGNITRVTRGAVAELTPPMLGGSLLNARLHHLVERYARVAPTPVHIQGETGVGKERAARTLHARSARVEAPFVALNCAILDSNLFESELFGHERGAFTGAHQRKTGLMELAHGGTLFLDEIGETPPAVQAKLLRAIETRSFRRVGGTREVHSDFWLITATNRNLLPEEKGVTFRPDLYYRIAALTLELPPLRERVEDIPALVGEICREFLGKHASTITFADGVLEAFEAYSWPGNVRELRNVIERALLLGKDNHISLPPGFGELPDEKEQVLPVNDEAGVMTLQDALYQAERVALFAALRATSGNRTAAAALLDISRATITRLIQRHGDGRRLGSSTQ